MLVNLQIKNILLIENAEIEFDNALCVLTGETGAGKSIILDCIEVILGAKFSNKIIRTDTSNASVTAIFNIKENKNARDYLEENDIEIDEELTIRRTMDSSNKSKIFINGNLVSQTELKSLGKFLVEIHGQNDQSGLLNSKTHLSILDEFGDYNQLLTQVRNQYSFFKSIEEELNKLNAEIADIQKEEEYLKYLIEEIEDLNPKQGEEEDLTIKRTYLMNKDKIIQIILSSLKEVTDYQDVEKGLSNASRVLSRNNSEFDSLIEALDRTAIEFAEVINLFESKKSELMNSDDDIDQIEKRLFALKAISKKYNKHSDELNDYLEESKEKISKLLLQTNNHVDLENKLYKEKKLYIELAQELDQERLKWARILEEEIHKELSYLHMGKAQFKVDVTKIDEEIGSATGVNKVTFCASTNPGQGFSPIANIASGGELSRFMLALKVILSKNNHNITLIFDEIDSGIGGIVADSVGNRLSKLSKNNQILLITHQPQIAAKANLHLYVSKEQLNDHTQTIVRSLNSKEREEEIARMLAGKNITDEVLKVAKQMING